MISPDPITKNWNAINEWPPRAFIISCFARLADGSRTTNSINFKQGAKSLFIPVCLILLLILPNLCHAQWLVTQQGHLLDANPRIGSMGINPNANLDALIPRVNLMITGNITGGGRFQGDIPYRSVGEFNADLGSGLLSNFRRDSVGVANLSRGIALPQPYLDQSRSLTGTGFRGGRVARSHQAYQPTKIPPRTQGPGAINYINQGLSLPSSRQSTFSPAFRSFGFGGLSGLSYPPPAQTTGLADTPLDLRYQSQPQNSTGLIRPINIPLQPQDLRIQSQTQTTTPQTSEQAQLTQDAAEAFPPDYQSSMQNYQTEFSEYINLFIQPWSYGISRSSMSKVGAAQTLLPPGRNLIVKPAPTKPPPATSRPLGAGRTKVGFLPLSKTISAPPAFAAADRPQPGNYLTHGQKMMRQGKYYQAAEAFEKAVIHDSAGPTGLLARAHALFAAGEFVSSAQSLNQALVQDPKLLETKIDLPELFGNDKKFNLRLEELDRLSEQTQYPVLSFLKGYLLFRTGLPVQAKTALTQARRAQFDIPAIDHLLNAINNLDKIKQHKDL